MSKFRKRNHKERRPQRVMPHFKVYKHTPKRIDINTAP